MNNKNYSTKIENIIFYLARYGLPRNTTCVPDIVEYIIENKDKMRGTEKAKLIIDIQRSFENGTTKKSNCFSLKWLEIIKELEK